jgi:hypothetical protein
LAIIGQPLDAFGLVLLEPNPYRFIIFAHDLRNFPRVFISFYAEKMNYLHHPGGQNYHFLLPISRVVLHCLIIVALAFSFLPATQTIAAGVTYLDAAATGGNNGVSWVDAYASLQTAPNSSTTLTIWIA